MTTNNENFTKKHGFQNKEFMDFLRFHKEEVNDLLDDFAHVILHYLLVNKKGGISSEDCIDDVDIVTKIFEQDMENKKLLHLVDTISPYIKKYVDLDICWISKGG